MSRKPISNKQELNEQLSNVFVCIANVFGNEGSSKFQDEIKGEQIEFEVFSNDEGLEIFVDDCCVCSCEFPVKFSILKKIIQNSVKRYYLKTLR